jgi:dephospho-CoA kinase
MAGSGKSEVARMVAARGWSVVYFGGATIDELKRRGMEITPDNERTVREELRSELGPDAYAKLARDKITDSLAAGPTAIDGLYSWAEYLYVRRHIDHPLEVVCVYTPRALRYERLASRDFRPLTAQQAEDRDFAEIERLDKGGPIALADHVVLNDGSIEQLAQRLDNLLSAISVPRPPA